MEAGLSSPVRKVSHIFELVECFEKSCSIITMQLKQPCWKDRERGRDRERDLFSQSELMGIHTAFALVCVWSLGSTSWPSNDVKEGSTALKLFYPTFFFPLILPTATLAPSEKQKETVSEWSLIENQWIYHFLHLLSTGRTGMYQHPPVKQTQSRDTHYIILGIPSSFIPPCTQSWLAIA